MKICIVGRSGSGKDTLVSFLQKYGLQSVLSYTTRPRRSPDESTHLFVTEEEAARLTDRVAETVINGYTYFATREQVEACDLYIIDPKGFYTLIRNMPDTAFVLVYLYANPDEARERALTRGNPETEAKIWEARRKSEDEQFLQLEHLLEEGHASFANCPVILRYHNTYDRQDMEEYAGRLAALVREWRNLESVVDTLAAAEKLNYVSSDRIGVCRKRKGAITIEYVSKDNFIGLLVSDREGLAAAMSAYLALPGVSLGSPSLADADQTKAI